MSPKLWTRRTFRDRFLPGLGLLAVLLASLGLARNAWDRPSPTFRLKATGGRLPGPKQRLTQALTRLIHHARTTIEKQARKQGLSPDAAWALAIGGHETPQHDHHEGAALADRGGCPLE